jgi:HEAT repeat protein
VFILGQLKNTALLDRVVVLITHREQRVRKEVLKYLIAVPDSKAKPYILKFLRDEASAIRIMALQMMGRARLQFALKPIAAFADTVEFEQMNISEKKAVYEAIGELGGEKMLPLFKTMLTKRFLFNKAKEKDAVICAVAGLQKIPGEETLKILEGALRSKSLEFRDIINNAILMVSNLKHETASRQQER